MIFETPCRDWNECFEGGIHSGSLTLICGRPRVGKTYVLRTLMNHFCSNGVKVMSVGGSLGDSRFYTDDVKENAVFKRVLRGDECLIGIQALFVDNVHESSLNPGHLSELSRNFDVAVIAACSATPLFHAGRPYLSLRSKFESDVILDVYRGRRPDRPLRLHVVKNKVGNAGKVGDDREGMRFAYEDSLCDNDAAAESVRYKKPGAVDWCGSWIYTREYRKSGQSEVQQSIVYRFESSATVDGEVSIEKLAREFQGAGIEVTVDRFSKDGPVISIDLSGIATLDDGPIIGTVIEAHEGLADGADQETSRLSGMEVVAPRMRRLRGGWRVESRHDVVHHYDVPNVVTDDAVQGGDVDHSGETFNPYSGRWGYL